MSAVDPVFGRWASEGLVWLPERGMGYFPVSEQPYDQEYFAKYQGYATTDLGRAITRARVDLVNSYVGDETAQVRVVDVGIGCGDFVASRGGETYGFDINPAGIEWLVSRGRWLDPYSNEVYAVTLWDVLEHIPDPGPLFENVLQYVFVSLPIFTDARHVLSSKHFRRDEHCWYWTRDGLIAWMAEHRFGCVEHNTTESLLGREDVHTFVFGRR